MKIPRILSLLALALAIAAPSLAQDTKVELNIGAFGYSCGRITTVESCYGIPAAFVDADGVPISSTKIWLDAPGFVQVAGQDYPITSSFQPLITGAGQYTLAYSFGARSSITLTYKTVYSTGGGGRIGGAGWRWILVSGDLDFEE